MRAFDSLESSATINMMKLTAEQRAVLATIGDAGGAASDDKTSAAKKKASKRNGRKGGRPPIDDAAKMEKIKDMRAAGASIRAIARAVKLSSGTVVKNLS